MSNKYKQIESIEYEEWICEKEEIDFYICKFPCNEYYECSAYFKGGVIELGIAKSWSEAKHINRKYYIKMMKDGLL